MDGINRNIHMLIQSVKKSSVYKEYRFQEGILNQNPELAERVRQFRADNFRLQNEEDRSNMFHLAEVLSRESEELRRIPQVNAYLDAELALCRMMQRICRILTEGIEMDIPPL
ncbi:MAG: YlbF family regulator [Blautia sp.]|uniref:YlbF family regulator n=1 Tax=Blautia sp. TaxID=1955243 RepID=UPI003991A7F5